MTKHDLKELAAMGAELGAAKAEVERMREALRKIIERCELFINDEADMRTHSIEALMGIAEDALSQHAEPTDTYTAVDMATAAAQGFRDGLAAVEQELRAAVTAQPAEAEGVERWNGLKLAAEVAEEDGPWDPRVGLTDCEAAFAKSASPAVVLELIAALSAVTAERDAANSRLHEVAVACAEAEQERERLRAEVDKLRKAAEPLEPVHGDQLPPIGSKVLIHLASCDDWIEHKVAGYYAWGDLEGDEYLHRVFVRARDSDGYLNARLLKDVRPVEAAMAAKEA